ncbi:MAG: TonB-dependent receptor plug domain-containing protein, partial [Moraxellaceae bacterium]|nr:TonB-dependent receptor plug domain-containing protein [Moraxellaceae bacterium]
MTLALLALVPSAQAQEQDPVELLPTMVVVASRLQEPLAQVQSSVAVVTRDEMEKQVAQDSADMVRYVPGLRVDTDT